MRLSRLRMVPVALALAAVALALVAAGCTATPAPDPTHTLSAHDHSDSRAGDVDAAWLVGTRLLGIVTWGSSTPTCRPRVRDVSAVGQRITVRLDYPAEASQGCDSDLRPQGNLVTVPDGVDVEKDVEVTVHNGKETGVVTIAPPNSEGPAKSPPFGTPSAGWFADDGILLLTYGSSSCPPILGEVEMTDARATAHFATEDRMCTADMAPRVTPILLPKAADRSKPFVLTLQGDDLDGEVQVEG